MNLSVLAVWFHKDVRKRLKKNCERPIQFDIHICMYHDWWPNPKHRCRFYFICSPHSCIQSKLFVRSNTSAALKGELQNQPNKENFLRIRMPILSTVFSARQLSDSASHIWCLELIIFDSLKLYACLLDMCGYC